MAPLTARGSDGCMLGEGDATVVPHGRVLVDPSTRRRRSSPFQRARLLTTPDVDTVDLLFADVKDGWRADTNASVYRYPYP